jgi:hypothetical protein
MKKSVILMLFLLVIMSSSVFALSVDVEPINPGIFPGEEATFELTVTNTDNDYQDVEVKTLAYDWKLVEGEALFGLSAGVSKTLQLAYQEKIARAPGFYDVNILVKSDESRVEDYVTIEVIDKTKFLNAKLITKEVDPRMPALVSINITNKYNKNIEPVKLFVESDLFSETLDLELGANEYSNLIFELDLDPATLEGDHAISFKAISDADIVYLNKDLNLKITRYENLNSILEEFSGFIVWGENLTETNDGNSIMQRFYTKEFTGLTKSFTKFSPEPTFVKSEEGRLIAQWNYELQPGETFNLYHKTNFGTTLIVLILIGLVITLLYYVLRKPVVISKKVMALHSSKGKIALMKVVIYVKNKRGYPLTNVTLLEKIPKMIKAPTQFGNDKPQVGVVGNNTRLVWSASLRPKQEKVFSYKIESSVKFIGKIRLPRSVAIIKLKGRKKVAKSNSAILKEI